MSIRQIVASAIFTLLALTASAQTKIPEKAFINNCLKATKKIFELQKKIQDLHPLLKKVYQIAVVENNQMYMFNFDQQSGAYKFSKKQETPFPMPAGLKASFPVNNVPTCVVSKDIFDSLEGYVIIFHEFMHCAQMEICENSLKETLEIAKIPYEKKDFSWELNHPFPYNNAEFNKHYPKLMHALDANEESHVVQAKTGLKNCLNQIDFQYMNWQEWKEGFARFIENKIRHRLKLKTKETLPPPPLNRGAFYIGGAKTIEYLSRQDPAIILDLQALFLKIRSL